LRLTVDTIDDYKLMESIYNALWKGRPILLKDVIDYLKKKNKL
jgi:spore coat polysaccharide biosynthesis protein SpsF (cytidylyltransferase family)